MYIAREKTGRSFPLFCEKNDPVVIAGGLMKSEMQEARAHVSDIDGWLDRFVVNLAPEGHDHGGDCQ
jgi:hypothetical protein